jgi:hypothetical protein
VERRHGVADSIGSANGIILAPGPISIHSTDDLGSSSSNAAGYAGTNVLAAPAAYATDNSIDFRPDRHPGDG